MHEKKHMRNLPGINGKNNVKVEENNVYIHLYNGKRCIVTGSISFTVSGKTDMTGKKAENNV